MKEISSQDVQPREVDPFAQSPLGNEAVQQSEEISETRKFGENLFAQSPLGREAEQGEGRECLTEDINVRCTEGGGSYRAVLKYVRENHLEDREVHHMPADSISSLERMDGPCIEMDAKDHHKTASYGSSRDAKDYRAAQKALIENGDFEGAMKMDIEDIKEKFGSKYDHQIAEMLEYTSKIKEAGEI